MKILAACTLLGMLASGCVSRTAGYDDVRQLVKERTGRVVHHDALHDDDDFADQVTEKIIGEPLTVERAVQLALVNNPEMQAAFEELGIARGHLQSALALPNPELEVGLGFSGDAHSPDIDFGVMVSLSQLIFMAPRESAADAELDEAKLKVAGRALDLAYRARTAFYRHQADAQILELRKTVLTAAHASYESTRAIFDAGNITELRILSEQAMYEEARLGMQQAEAVLAMSREQLGAMLGLWGRRAAWTIRGRLGEPKGDAPDVAQLERQALERSLDLEAIAAGYTAAARRANLSTATGVLPELRAGVEVQRDSGELEVGPKVAIQIPLFYQNQGETRTAESAMRRQEQLHSATALKIRAAARSAATRMRASHERARYYETVLIPLRSKILDETMKAYNAMGIGVVELLVAKRDQIETGRMYVEALREYWLARADVDQLRAGRLIEGMAMSEPIDMGRQRGGGGH
jgi:cobalt-zinc-cadmium efflux system outer membrane protein